MKTKAIYSLYRTLQAFGLPLLLLYFLFRGYRDRRYIASLRERLGFLPRSFEQTTPGAIWLHAVSVGEVLSAIEVLRRLREEFPRMPVFVSTSTLAGRAMADEKLRALATGIFYTPVDYVFAVRRVLRTLRPSVIVVAETEIWPNLFREVKRTGAGLLIVNGRISDRAAPRYLAWRWFFRNILQWPDLILAQSEALREMFVRIGAPAEKVQVGGNLKYDFQPKEAASDSPVRQYLSHVRPEKLWIAASTMPGQTAGDVDEDDVVIEAFRKVAAKHPGLLLLLAPRKPERFDLVAQKLEQAGVFYSRRSRLGGRPPDLPHVLLLDTIGELSGFFFLADVVFMGGTLAQRGGHNILEPAFFGRPVIIGPHMENFRAIADEFRAEGACFPIGEADELVDAVDRLLQDGACASQIGQKALRCAKARRGATSRAVEEIRRLHETCLPCFRSLWRPVLLPLSWLWTWGASRKQDRDLAVQRRLDGPVISVGNLTMGGTGKTPVVLYLSRKIADAGHRPGILTRGYGRHSPDRHLALPPNASVPVEHSGDEPQIFLRSGLAPVGIGPDRYQTGKMLEERFGVDVLILDDGFQHLRLARQVDIVLVSALDPFSGGEVFPLGRLREPMEGLARADIFVITRSDYGCVVPGIEAQLRRYNRRAPIYYSRVVPETWVEQASGRCCGPSELPYSRVGAFCGLGNHDSFWCTLADLGLEPVERVAFADHHLYRPREIRHMSEQFRLAKAEAVLTTEKDALNLCDASQDLLAPLPLYWLRIGAVLEREDQFLEAVLTRMRSAH